MGEDEFGERAGGEDEGHDEEEVEPHPEHDWDDGLGWVDPAGWWWGMAYRLCNDLESVVIVSELSRPMRCGCLLTTNGMCV